MPVHLAQLIWVDYVRVYHCRSPWQIFIKFNIIHLITYNKPLILLKIVSFSKYMKCLKLSSQQLNGNRLYLSNINQRSKTEPPFQIIRSYICSMKWFLFNYNLSFESNSFIYVDPFLTLFHIDITDKCVKHMYLQAYLLKIKRLSQISICRFLRIFRCSLIWSVCTILELICICTFHVILYMKNSFSRFIFIPIHQCYSRVPCVHWSI